MNDLNAAIRPTVRIARQGVTGGQWLAPSVAFANADSLWTVQVAGPLMMEEEVAVSITTNGRTQTYIGCVEYAVRRQIPDRRPSVAGHRRPEYQTHARIRLVCIAELAPSRTAEAERVPTTRPAMCQAVLH